MVKKSIRYRACALAAVGFLSLGLAACGDDSDNDTSSSKNDSKSESSMTESTAASETFGDGCSAVPKEGEGSFEGMSNDPVATAASNNPALSTLVTAVQTAGLGETLNGAQNITVFAPANAAFEKIPAEDLQAVLADDAMLKKVLTYHVVGERITPDKLGTAGPYKTLEGGELTVTGSGTDYTVNGNSKVICGNVQTANATVYIVDSVLMPAA
ncbi:MAG: fasciclin domain-containing protein [Corynebacteriales bacterium]|nr:fasciclin domain-containing protein [Mycobacteriales bacterium]